MSLGGGADGRQEVAGTGVLQQVAGRARGEDVGNPLAVGERGERDDAGPRQLSQQQPGRRDAVEDGHRQVHEHHVRGGGGRGLESLLSVGGLAGHLDVGGGLEDGDQARPDELVVVDDEDADHVAAAS